MGCIRREEAASDDAITPELKATFGKDGVVKVPGAVDSEWVEWMLSDAQRQLREPGPWITDTNPGATSDRMFTSRYRWRQDEAIREFAFCSPIASMAAALSGSRSIRFYCDHLMVKESQTEIATPWHQDIPYWPFLGRQIVSAWVSATSSSVSESSLEFVRGSHKWDSYFAPQTFDGTDGDGGWVDDFKGEKMPDITSARSQPDCPYDIVGFDVEPGDAIFFSAWVVHGAPGNAGNHRRVALSTRWLGDDTTWFPHPGCDPTVTQDQTTAIPGEYLTDDTRFPLVYPPA